jgi:hypothetical protein
MTSLVVGARYWGTVSTPVLSMDLAVLVISALALIAIALAGRWALTR